MTPKLLAVGLDGMNNLANALLLRKQTARYCTGGNMRVFIIVATVVLLMSCAPQPIEPTPTQEAMQDAPKTINPNPDLTLGECNDLGCCLDNSMCAIRL
jgi:hypothetical protein